MVMNLFGKMPTLRRTDNGGEYVNKEVEYLKQLRIQHQDTVSVFPARKWSGGKKRSLIEMTRCMLLDTKVDKALWGEAA